AGFCSPSFGGVAGAPKAVSFSQSAPNYIRRAPANEWFVMKSRALAGMPADRRTTGALPVGWRSLLEHSFFRYGLAVLSVAAALGIKLILQKFIVGYP